MTDGYDTASLAQRPEMLAAGLELRERSWPEFMRVPDAGVLRSFRGLRPRTL